MSNSRRFRRGLRASTEARVIRFPEKPPALSTVRRAMRQLEAQGDVARAGVERTGRPGRPAVLWELTEQGRQRPSSPPLREVLPDLLARRAYALMLKGMSENQALAAVTRGWRRAAS